MANRRGPGWSRAEMGRAMARRSRLAGSIAAILLAVGACGIELPGDGTPVAYGPVRNEVDARAAALQLTQLEPPIEIVGAIRHGIAMELYTGVYGSCASEQNCRETEARRHRPAWRVDLTGLYPDDDCAQDVCPLVRWNQQLIIDEEAGTVLFNLSSTGPLP